MDVKRFSAATLAGGIAFMVMGWLIYEVLLSDFMAANSTLTMKDPPDWLWMTVSQLVLASVLVLVFTRWASISTLAGGAKAGALLYGLIGLSVGLDFYGFSTAFTLTAALLELVLSGIRGAIAGGVIGWVLGKMSS